MQRIKFVVFMLLCSCSLTTLEASPRDDIIDINGGMACGACTVLVGLIEQVAEVNNRTVTDMVSGLCDFLPDEYNMLCDILVHLWGPAVIEKLTRKESPDVVCYSLGICHVDPGQYYCHLFPEPAITRNNTFELEYSLTHIEVRSLRKNVEAAQDSCFTVSCLVQLPHFSLDCVLQCVLTLAGGMELAVERSRMKSKVLPFFHWTLVERLQSACELPGVNQVCRTITGAVNNMDPFLDLDSDKYSIVKTFRGDSWRGKDCDDVNEIIYPGRRPADSDIIMDSNCNGIYRNAFRITARNLHQPQTPYMQCWVSNVSQWRWYSCCQGLNETTGVPYEDEFCSDTKSHGIIFIGDSIGAHFHVPAQWFTATEITVDILRNFSFVLSNELDWPHASFATGYVNVTWPILNGYTDSFYLRLRERNLCNHRDFQNLCFNGAASGTMIKNLKSVARDPTDDKPAILFYAMMGNDVCNRYMSSLDDLTTPEEFKENVLHSLTLLNNTLPHGSHVLLVGLVNGSFIYDTMADRLHPIGEFHKDVKYSDVYEWFNCMRIGPCYGWMNKNATVREATTARAVELTDVLQEIATNEKYEAFDLHFLRNPVHQVIEQWEAEGKELWQFLEPVDSLHPVQEVLPLITEAMWNEILIKYPHILGSVNPNNDQIKAVFGDQGGH